MDFKILITKYKIILLCSIIPPIIPTTSTLNYGVQWNNLPLLS